MKNKKHIMVLDGQENVSKLCLCGSPRFLCGSLCSHYCVLLRGVTRRKRGDTRRQQLQVDYFSFLNGRRYFGAFI